MKKIHQVLKNCGNFSKEVLPGMIAYGREQERGRGHLKVSNDLPRGDGYASKEGDLILGGFIQRRAAQQAASTSSGLVPSKAEGQAATGGRHLSEMTLEERQKLALKVCNDHMTKHGAAGPEYYKHWMKRAESFARHHHVKLPSRTDRETHYQYFQRVHRWSMDQEGGWPKLRPAVGTHLVFSPDPKIWTELRVAGMDERKFLHGVIVGAMKEVGDWRRKIHGTGRSLGWTAGSHVQKDGADGHPHIHVMILKRDESGQKVDWSLSSIKGRKGREEEPDQLREAKRLFKKNVEKQYEQATGKPLQHDLSPSSSVAQQKMTQFKPLPRLKGLAMGLRAAARAMEPCRPSNAVRRIGDEIGAMIRIARGLSDGLERLPSFQVMQRKIAQWIHQQPEPEI